MGVIRQTLSVMALNLRTLPSRLSSSAVAVIGIVAIVVAAVRTYVTTQAGNIQ